MDCDYWKEIVSKLKILNQCGWAAHVLSTCIDEEGSNLSQALKCVNESEIIKNTIYAYKDWDAQPYCDQILLKFEKQKVIDVLGKIENKSKNMKKGIARLVEEFEK